MNFTIFNRSNGTFAELAASGILKVLSKAGVPCDEIWRMDKAMSRMSAGQYCYCGNYVITAVIGAVEIKP